MVPDAVRLSERSPRLDFPETPPHQYSNSVGQNLFLDDYDSDWLSKDSLFWMTKIQIDFQKIHFFEWLRFRLRIQKIHFFGWLWFRLKDSKDSRTKPSRMNVMVWRERRQFLVAFGKNFVSNSIYCVRSLRSSFAFSPNSCSFTVLPFNLTIVDSQCRIICWWILLAYFCTFYRSKMRF